MDAAIIPYDPYHPHLVYTLICTCVGWLAAWGYTSWKLGFAPVQRVQLYAVAMMLPLYAEVAALLIYLFRPAPDTQFGSALTHFHAFTLQRFPIDSFLSLTAQVTIMLALVSLTIFSLGHLLSSRARIMLLLHKSQPLAEVHPALAATFAGYATAQARRQPAVFVVQHHAPLAFATGILHPRIYVTTHFLNILEPAESIAVLCHEWAHIVRHDIVWNWVLLLVRNTVAFLPPTLLLWKKIQASQDEACDRLAIQFTQQPLVLAQALVKIANAWKHSTSATPPLITVKTFVAHNNSPRQRVEQMIRFSNYAPSPKRWVIVATYVLIGLLLILAPLPALLGS